MAMITWCLLTILASSSLCEAANILVVFPFPSRSHGILGEAFVRILLDAGHEVTYITPFPNKEIPRNRRDIDVSLNLQIFPTNLNNLKQIIENEKGPNDMKLFFSLLLNLSNVTFSNENVQELLNDSNQKFDLIIVEWMFSEIYAGLSAFYECPYIWVSTVDPHWIVMSLIDEALHPAYNADSLSGNIPPFSFRQRVQELFSQIFVALLRNFLLVSNEKTEYENVFGPLMAKKGKPMPSFEEMRYNASLMFGNSHVSLGQATRLPQSYKPIGGYHIDPNVKPLPEDLKRLMDNAKDGVIYFSMGSNLKSKELPEQIKRDLLKIFGGLKHTVIWKFEEVLPDLPKNVHILQWAPQPSILAHPNCVLFITHGGLLSTTETVHFGVPIIGIPVFGDQNTNVDRAIAKGFAKRVNLSYKMADDLKVAIEEILGNPVYTEKVKELSLIYHDRPVTPAKEMLHWVQHVIRTRGAPHLRSPALDVPWYQKLYLDLLALVVAVLYFVKFVIKRLLCRKSSIKNISDKKKKK